MLMNNEKIKQHGLFFFFLFFHVVLLTYSTCSSPVAARGHEGTDFMFGVSYV